MADQYNNNNNMCGTPEESALAEELFGTEGRMRADASLIDEGLAFQGHLTGVPVSHQQAIDKAAEAVEASAFDVLDDIVWSPSDVGPETPANDRFMELPMGEPQEGGRDFFDGVQEEEASGWGETSHLQPHQAQRMMASFMEIMSMGPRPSLQAVADNILTIQNTYLKNPLVPQDKGTVEEVAPIVMMMMERETSDTDPTTTDGLLDEGSVDAEAVAFAESIATNEQEDTPAATASTDVALDVGAESVDAQEDTPAATASTDVPLDVGMASANAQEDTPTATASTDVPLDVAVASVDAQEDTPATANGAEQGEASTDVPLDEGVASANADDEQEEPDDEAERETIAYYPSTPGRRNNFSDDDEEEAGDRQRSVSVSPIPEEDEVEQSGDEDVDMDDASSDEDEVHTPPTPGGKERAREEEAMVDPPVVPEASTMDVEESQHQPTTSSSKKGTSAIKTVSLKSIHKALDKSRAKWLRNNARTVRGHQPYRLYSTCKLDIVVPNLTHRKTDRWGKLRRVSVLTYAMMRVFMENRSGTERSVDKAIKTLEALVNECDVWPPDAVTPPENKANTRGGLLEFAIYQGDRLAHENYTRALEEKDGVWDDTTHARVLRVMLESDKGFVTRRKELLGALELCFTHSRRRCLMELLSDPERVGWLRRGDLWTIMTRAMETQDVETVEGVLFALEASKIKIGELRDPETDGTLLHYGVFYCDKCPEVTLRVAKSMGDVEHEDRHGKSVVALLEQMQASHRRTRRARLLKSLRGMMVEFDGE
jgi:hypothetical protein